MDTTMREQIAKFENYPKLLPLSDSLSFGVHMSIAGGYVELLKQMTSLNATASAFFTSQPRGWNIKFPELNKTQAFYEGCLAKNLCRNQFLAHAPYLINVCSDSEDTRAKSSDRLLLDAFIARLLGLDRLNFHPGSSSDSAGYIKIAQNINDVHAIIPDIVLVLETVAECNSKTTIGSSFASLKQIIDLVTDKSRVGVCIDTQHTFAGGFAPESSFGDDLLNLFKKEIGTEFLFDVHVNGSLTKYKSGNDRHQNLHMGELPLKQIEKFIKSLKTEGLKVPCVAETPNADFYKDEIQLMKTWAEQ
ncbi:Endonuclease_IV [Hexamita inflata]|uniref:Endonuclease IV n=1 Tax=Hexamita inflata TaxID=28002 RepID=A0AA86NU95_9EUKA|nr:Endonuclease IV [Hexamita inflata]